MEGDGLPNTICQKCVAKLNIAWQFKIQCENSDAKLRQFYSNTQHLQVTPDLDGFSLSLKQSDDNMYMLKQIPINNSNSYNLDTTTVELQNVSAEEKDDENMNNCDKKSKKLAKQKSEKTKEQKIHQCDTCGKTFNRREYLTQHIRIHTGSTLCLLIFC